MPTGILIVEHQETERVFALPPIERNDSQRTTWESFTPERLRRGEVSLLIVNAASECEKASVFFQWLKENPIAVPIFAIIPEHDPAILQAAAETADDFLLWPVRSAELNRRIARLAGPEFEESKSVAASLASEIGLRQMVGQAPNFLKVLDRAALFAASDAPVLLTGETGTGKELCARVIHLLSKRQGSPFIPLDCGALPDHLFENEVFGHARGAFTDARLDQKGLVALAQNGTFFMDEIDSLSLAAQGKVLRLLQEHTYRPLGSERFNEANVRIIAATNRDLEQLIPQKQFRSDLFFRINVLRIRLPGLRERRSDIPLLCRHFIEDICRTDGVPKKVLSVAAAAKLAQYDWPGNVRELHNTIQRAVLCSPGAQICASAIELRSFSESTEAAYPNFRSAKLSAIETFEQDYVRQLMEKNDGNVTRAAREAGKDRRAFGRLVRKYAVRARTI